MQRGENAKAIDRIKDAIANARGNRDYRRTLAEAELAAGRTADAESTLTDLLQSDSTDGPRQLDHGARDGERGPV
jgi:thioredoxin-like negative regulator of GroEL